MQGDKWLCVPPRLSGPRRAIGACQMGENEGSKRISGERYIHFMCGVSQAVLTEQQLVRASIRENFSRLVHHDLCQTVVQTAPKLKRVRVCVCVCGEGGQSSGNWDVIYLFVCLLTILPTYLLARVFICLFTPLFNFPCDWSTSRSLPWLRCG